MFLAAGVHRWRVALITLLAAIVTPDPASWAQLTTGLLEGSTETRQGATRGPIRLDIEGPLRSTIALLSDSHGNFSTPLPMGEYTIRAPDIQATCHIRIRPLATTRCELRSGENQSADADSLPHLASNSAAEILLLEAPANVTHPLDFAGLGSTRIPLVSGPSTAQWTATSFRLNGLDATDSYQPGLPLTLDDLAALDSIAVRDASAADAIPLDAYDVELALRGPGRSWGFGLITQDTNAALAGDNVPRPPGNGRVEQPDLFRWFSRDSATLDGIFGHWADLAATATGQWASQTDPQLVNGTPIHSRMLFGNVRGRARLGRSDQIDALYSGSRVDLSSRGWPAGIEAVIASSVMPCFYGATGFADLREVDHFDLVQLGWTHQFGGTRVLELRYGYSTAHLDTSPNSAANQAPIIDLLAVAPAAAPLTNFAIRTRQDVNGGYEVISRFAGVTHRLTLVAEWESSRPRNRFFETGSGEDTITLAGQPAFLVRLNTPAETSYQIDTFSPGTHDIVGLGHGVTLDLGIVLDVARGKVAGNSAAISWASPSPRAGFAVAVPGFSRMAVGGSYSLTWSRLAGRYLDFADPSALSGLVYSVQTGQLVERFGGSYSTIAPDLKRPYAGEFHTFMRIALPFRSSFSVDLSRRDEKDRIAAVDNGVSAEDYQPVVIDEPAPFAGQFLTVYAQNPATLGRDQYLLTNPAGLQELSEAAVAAAHTRLLNTYIGISFTAEKSFGPANPGNSPWANDPGIIGALYSNPNTLINATGHPFLDRAFIGKFQTVTQAPKSLGGIQLSNTIVYLDGLPFARELLVTGLPQGPFLVDATVHGSPEGGSRAQHVLNWNLRVSRQFGSERRRFTVAADILNLLNNGDKIVESDLSGPNFNERSAIAFPPPRILRLSAGWSF